MKLSIPIRFIDQNLKDKIIIKENIYDLSSARWGSPWEPLGDSLQPPSTPALPPVPHHNAAPRWSHTNRRLPWDLPQIWLIGTSTLAWIFEMRFVDSTRPGTPSPSQLWWIFPPPRHHLALSLSLNEGIGFSHFPILFGWPSFGFLISNFWAQTIFIPLSSQRMSVFISTSSTE